MVRKRRAKPGSFVEQDISSNDDYDDIEDYSEDEFDDPNDLSDEKKNAYDDTYDEYSTSNNQDAELAKILMETDTYINRIELTLKNQYMKKMRIINKETGHEEISQIPTQVEGTRPMANSYGISQIIGLIKAFIHHATGQANIDKEEYRDFAGRYIKHVGRSLVVHRKKWGMKEEELRDVRRIVTDGVLFFMTRAIGDRERVYNRNFQVKDDGGRPSSGFLANIGSKLNARRGRE